MRILLYIIPCIWISLAQAQDTAKIVYRPIGYFETDYTPETGAPRQGILIAESKGKIILKTEYGGDALDFLDWFEYIIVLYHFDLASGWQAHVEPPASNHEHNFGIYSTRSPKRPNPIAMSIVKLEKISGDTLFIRGVDAFDGTPVLDIKAYLPSVDMIKSLQNEMIEKELGHHDELYIKDSIFYR
ncbi:MAG: tRNA (N6-threonylcarbamoyladenosine(37)-N6)-methyltransferase TrmO [Bacteroidota bacterium]|nr:tRNA (N6-threonylcarbamoyladenosine(37)-N6)-methyltransferase TrmO [Bacteroidota bacterium]